MPFCTGYVIKVTYCLGPICSFGLYIDHRRTHLNIESLQDDDSRDIRRRRHRRPIFVKIFRFEIKEQISSEAAKSLDENFRLGDEEIEKRVLAAKKGIT